MSDDLKNILNNSNKDIDNQHLMDYLSQQLSKQESHELEKMMVDDPFINDAMEGLEQLPGKKSMAISVEQLNRDLQKQLAKKKNRKEKRKLKEQPWVYFAIILLLILTIVCYFMVKKYMESKSILPGKPATAQHIY
jgi:cytochrome c-type biogenesis protein CcmH/NrfG